MVTDFTYFGSKVNLTNDIVQQTQHMIMKIARPFYVFHAVANDSKRQKLLFKHCYNRSPMVAKLGFSPRDLKKYFVRKVLTRPQHGPVMVDNGWIIQINHELSQLYKMLDIVRFMKIQSLQWARHMEKVLRLEFRKKQ